MYQTDTPDYCVAPTVIKNHILSLLTIAQGKLCDEQSLIHKGRKLSFIFHNLRMSLKFNNSVSGFPLSHLAKSMSLSHDFNILCPKI